MSRAERRRSVRGDGGKTASRGRSRAPLWILSGAVVSGLVVVGLVANAGRTHRHPEPRLASEMPRLMPPGRYGPDTRTSRAYEAAWAIPTVLDGLYCYCRCSEHSGHRSLLDCFASDHASACDICMREGEIAYEMTLQGQPLDAIREEVDAFYGRG